jgi:hypothetical protein
MGGGEERWIGFLSASAAPGVNGGARPRWGATARRAVGGYGGKRVRPAQRSGPADETEGALLLRFGARTLRMLRKNRVA